MTDSLKIYIVPCVNTFLSHGGSASRGRRLGVGEDDFSRGRKFTSDDLRLLLLALLADAPRHGYELIKLLDARSNGFYKPSPGMIYPALTNLDELRLATVEMDGNRKRYAMTQTGHSYLGRHRERVDMLWAKLKFLAQKMTLVRRAIEAGDAEGAKGDGQPLDALTEARARLWQALFDRRYVSADEQDRIARVLAGALREIEAGNPSANR